MLSGNLLVFCFAASDRSVGTFFAARNCDNEQSSKISGVDDRFKVPRPRILFCPKVFHQTHCIHDKQILCMTQPARGMLFYESR